MKTAVKLIFVYFVMQVLGAFLVAPFAMLYAYGAYGAMDKATELSMAPALLAGMALMAGYLWRNGHLTGDKRLYSPVSASYLCWSGVMGVSVIVLVDFLMSFLTFLPDWMSDTFDVLQSGWVGIVSITLLGPILEELLFRGAITKALLKSYSPVQAMLLSGLLFGLVHINPMQVVGATLSGFVFAWIYYRTRSLVPCILIHVLNNSLSVCLSLAYPEVMYLHELTGSGAYAAGVITAFLLFLLSWRMMNAYKLSQH